MAMADRAANKPTWRAEDRRRLERARGGPVDPGASLFSPRGQVWRVNREAVLLAGGGRALLMQVAHPLVAAGVARHSAFEREPLLRLWRTLDLTLTIVFADAAGALAAVQQIERRHRPVHGRLDEAVGRFAAGTEFDANDPELQHWVHATLVDSAMVTFERFVTPLSNAEKEELYQESKITARLFGIPEPTIPATHADFAAYVRDMVEGDTLCFGRDGRRVADSIMDPPLPPGLRQIAGSGRILTEGLLPPALRERLGYAWSDRRQRRLERAAALSRRTLPLLPARVRYFPHAVRAGKAGAWGVGRGAWG